jgi:hypothetical protein
MECIREDGRRGVQWQGVDKPASYHQCAELPASGERGQDPRYVQLFDLPENRMSSRRGSELISRAFLQCPLRYDGAMRLALDRFRLLLVSVAAKNGSILALGKGPAVGLCGGLSEGSTAG